MVIIIVENLNIKQGRFYKKYRLHCSYCGCDHYIPFFLLKIRYLFTDKIYYHCDCCHRVSNYRIFYHIVHDTTDKEEKIFNKETLWDIRMMGK